MAVNLTKVPKVNLTKGQSVNLTKDGTDNSEELNKVFFGAKWGSIKHGGFLGFFGFSESVDLDASLICYNSKLRVVDTVYFGKRYSSDGAIRHSGDDLHGSTKESDRDNETISIELSKVRPDVEYIVAILNSFRHHKFDKIPYMKLRIYTGAANYPDEILCAYDIKNNESFKGKEAIVLGYFYRSNGGWKFQADGTTSNEKSIAVISYGTALTVIDN